MNQNNYKNIDDQEIIQKIRNENKPELFEVLYLRYYDKVVNKVYSFIKEKKKAEEFTNDIFSRVYEKLNSFKGNSAFSSWLFSVTYNYCIDYLRTQKKLHYPDWNKKNVIPEIIDETEEDLPEPSYENLLKVLELIHPEEKAMLLMKYQDGVSLKQIAASLRISEDAVKMRLKRAKTRLLYIYKQHYKE